MTDETYLFDFNQLTSRQLGLFRDYTGHGFADVVDEKGELDFAKMHEHVVAGIIWLAMIHSGRADATFDDALDIPWAALDFQAKT